MSISVTRQRVRNAYLLEYASENRNEGFFNDLTIIAGDESIPANRLVLSYHSKYLEGIFKTSYLKDDKCIEINCVDGASVKALIDYIYTGSITINDQNVMILLSGANYLQLAEVKQFCFEFLQLNIRRDNSLCILKAATVYNNNALQDEVKRYVSSNFDAIAQTGEFKILSKQDLTFCISTVDRFLVNETSIYQAMVTWTRYNEETRAIEFPELFKLVNLNKIAIDFLEDIVLKENLVLCSPICKDLACSRFCYLKKEICYSNESHVISFGGTNTREKVTVVLNLSQEAQQNYTNFVEGFDSHCCLKLDDHIYSIGGRILCGNKFKPTNQVAKINIKGKKRTWEKVAPMKQKRYVMGASMFRDTIVVAGGADKRDNTISSVEFYVPAKNKWKSGPSLIQRRKGNALVSCNGCLYALGGWGNGECLSSVERLEDLNKSWQIISPMQTQRTWFAAVNCDGVVYAIGGRFGKNDSTALKTVEKYDTDSNQWKYVSEMKHSRRAHAACVLRSKIYVVGGIDAHGSIIKEIECYDPVNDTWSIVGNVTCALLHHTLVAA